MSTMDSKSDERLIWWFKHVVNRFIMLHWRLGVGWMLNIYPALFGRFMVLVHIGRKTRLQRYTPLNYAIVEGELYCTAGFGATAAWYRNIIADPRVEVWLPGGWWAGEARDVSTCAERLPLLRAVLQGSGFVAPLLGIFLTTMSDEEFDTSTHSYRLIHIRRVERRSGPDGPGDLLWVWPWAAVLLLLHWLARRR